MLGAGLPKKLFRKKMKFGIIFKIIMYILLLDFAFIYLYPFLHMIINSLKSSDDLIADCQLNRTPVPYSADSLRHN